jgi:NADH-ubiquinone oxidoreductase chain 5
MEGPTPVSALIHAATMVTAGVFLLIRSSTILEQAPYALTVITIIGALTAFLAATIGIFQYDIKKVIAYSTCSQLGYMVFTCGISAYSVSLFHLINHGFFKALLFLSAGNIIHGLANEQDMRKLGGLIKTLPYTFSIMFIGSLSLMGFPYLTGYYSKDTILELAQAPLNSTAFLAFLLGLYSAFVTAFYSLRLIYYTFISNTNANLNLYSYAHDVKKHVTFVLTFLSIASVLFGYIFKDAYIGIGSDFFNASIPTYNETYITIEADFLLFIKKFTPVFFSIIAATFAIYIN